MVADWLLLNIFGENPAQYSQDIDKWAALFARFVFYGIPVFLILLFLSPYIFLLIKRKPFSIKNIFISTILAVLLIFIGIFLVWFGIYYWQGIAFKGFYGID